MGAGALKAKHYIFVGVGRAVFFLFLSSGRLAFVKMYNPLQVVVLLKNAVLWVSFVQMGSLEMKKKKKKKDEQTNSRFSREVTSRRNTVLYPGKTRLKPRLFLPAILARN